MPRNTPRIHRYCAMIAVPLGWIGGLLAEFSRAADARGIACDFPTNGS